MKLPTDSMKLLNYKFEYCQNDSYAQQSINMAMLNSHSIIYETIYI